MVHHRKATTCRGRGTGHGSQKVVLWRATGLQRTIAPGGRGLVAIKAKEMCWLVFPVWALRTNSPALLVRRRRGMGLFWCMRVQRLSL